MCSEPLYAIRLKTQYDDKYKRFGIRTPIIVLRAVREVGKDLSQLNYNASKYDLIMISCGQCLQCRLLRSEQRAVMSVCESLEHEQNSFITLTFGYPQTYAYYRHTVGLSHYLASKKAHFHEWSLDTATFQKFMKRLRNWYYYYQLANHLFSIGRGDLVPDTYPYVTHIRLPILERPFLTHGFKPKRIRFMHCGEYGSRKNRSHHHAILYGIQFPDLEEYYEDDKKYYTSKILKELWPFGIHCIGECTYNSSAYVARYVTKKINGNNQEEFYNGRKPEYVSYSTRPIIGSNYFKKNIDEFINTGVVSVVLGEKYECPIPKSYEKIIKEYNQKKYEIFKEERVKKCLKDLDELLASPRSIYAKLDSKAKLTINTLNRLVRSYEQGAYISYIHVDEYIKKAQAFGLNCKYFIDEFSERALKYLSTKNYKNHTGKSSNSKIREQYYKFELARKRHISRCYDLRKSDEQVEKDVNFYKTMPNPFKCMFRGVILPDLESINENSVIDENGKEILL